MGLQGENTCNVVCSKGIANLLEEIVPSLKDFHSLLKRKPEVSVVSIHSVHYACTYTLIQ